MTATTTATDSTSRSPRNAAPSPRGRSKPSTTSNGFRPGRPSASATQSSAPRLSPNPPGGGKSSDDNAVSPNYFGLVVEPSFTVPTNSDAGTHAKGNWKLPSSIGSKAATSPRPVPHEENPDLAEFRRQSDAYAFSLGKLHRLHSGVCAPTASSPLARTVERSQSDGYFPDSSQRSGLGHYIRDGNADPNTDASISPVSDLISPTTIEGRLLASPTSIGSTHEPNISRDASYANEHEGRLSLPSTSSSQPLSRRRVSDDARAASLPQTTSQDGPIMLGAEDFVELYESAFPDDLLLLDLRVAPQYAKSHIRGALNLCIPTTLLKRPSFNVQRLSDAFTGPDEKMKFGRWRDIKHIVVYDFNASNPRDAQAAVNTLKKFVLEGWVGVPYIICGGFQAVSKQYAHLVEKVEIGKGGGLNKKGLKLQPESSSVQVAGGCPLPAEKSAANPFFGNIRQNMDLIGGVGQIEIKLPAAIRPRNFGSLPTWLQHAAASEDKGKAVADRFLDIEKAEQRRMQAALSGDVQYGTPLPDNKDTLHVAGIEKGAKNRYKDILPFDHSRVRLEDSEGTGCDYINASHVKSEWSYRHYIAAQAPVPATFEDFWRAVWEQDVRVIIMLTAEKEGGQQKAHPYWAAGDYGPLKVKALSEKRVALVPPPSMAAKVKHTAQLHSPPLERAAASMRRRATNPVGFSTALQEAPPAVQETEIPQALVRKLALHHASFAFEPLREITQVHFSQWPDFGAISATELLGLVEQCSTVARVYNQPSNQTPAAAAAAHNPLLPAPSGERPILVHCSAGCGRTGTFCTIDTVIDLLKRQRMSRRAKAVQDSDTMDVDDPTWIHADDVDLIAKTVEDFRLQRLSMVQTLQQYVLCYEAVLEWFVKQHPDKFLKDQMRRSFQG